MLPFYFFATVTDAQDPDGLGRVRVSRQGDAEGVTDWIQVLTPWAGDGTGFFALPPVGSQVLVLALDGCEARKVVIGGLWGEGALPPVSGENPEADLNKDGNNSLRFFRSRAGSMFIFDDTEGAEKIQIIAPGGASRLEFLPAEEKISLKADGELAIEAKGALRFSANEIELECKEALSAEGAEISVAAKKGCEIRADKDLVVKGASVALN
ncbi:MAG: phage baseplate assembly protein V [Spirochaetaceae bacterium]|nr:phage baseplate assembly protein V [Spirochaetaceae bacterium]